MKKLPGARRFAPCGKAKAATLSDDGSAGSSGRSARALWWVFTTTSGHGRRSDRLSYTRLRTALNAPCSAATPVTAQEKLA